MPPYIVCGGCSGYDCYDRPGCAPNICSGGICARCCAAFAIAVPTVIPNMCCGSYCFGCADCFCGGDLTGMLCNPPCTPTPGTGVPFCYGCFTPGLCAAQQSACMPCGPLTCGTTDNLPLGPCFGSQKSVSCFDYGGVDCCEPCCNCCKCRQNGSGSAGSPNSGGGSAKAPVLCSKSLDNAINSLSSAMSKFGSTIATLLSGGKAATTASTLHGTPAPEVNTTPMTSVMFLLIAGIVCVLLVAIAYGKRGL
jgi:hypothetical protein